MLELCSKQLKLYSAVKATTVDWLWYPYIPFGKITLLQGDPGGGKSTLMLRIISAVSNGTAPVNGEQMRKPIHIIYQCSEDGTADTIKPRLMKAGANCDQIAFLDEDIEAITLNDEKLRRAIADFNVKLLVIDPFQAYLGDADMSNASSIRKVVRQLGIWAAAYDCAVVLIGHLNKKQGSKDIYRGLGSIDLVAAARSVLQVEICDDAETRVLRHIKSSLAPKGHELFFYIDSSTGVQWLDIQMTEHSSPAVSEPYLEIMNKQERTAEVLKNLLHNGPVKASEIKLVFDHQGISEKTLMLTKKFLGITSFRKGGNWFWAMPMAADSKQRMRDINE